MIITYLNFVSNYLYICSYGCLEYAFLKVLRVLHILYTYLLLSVFATKQFLYHLGKIAYNIILGLLKINIQNTYPISITDIRKQWLF